VNIEKIRKNSLKNKFKSLAGDTVSKKKTPEKLKVDLAQETEKEKTDDEDTDEDKGGDAMGDDEFDEDDDFDEEDEFDDSTPKKGGGDGDNTVLLDRLDELEQKLSKTDVSLSIITKENDGMVDKINKLDETTIQFLSLYEIISDQVNPFVGEGAMSSAVTERFDQIEARIAQVEEIDAVVKNIEARLNTIQGDTGGDLATISEVVTNLSQKIETLEARISTGGSSEEVDLKFNNVFQRLTEIGVAEEEIKAEFASFNEVVDELKELKTQNVVEEKRNVGYEIIEKLGEIESPELSVNAQNSHPARRKPVEPVEDNPVQSLVLIRWVEFLLERVGRNNLLEALNYYVHIGWINKELRNQAMGYATGMDYYKDKPEWRLSPDDHKKSLLFIEMIHGNEVDMITVNLVEQEVLKLKNLMGGDYGI